MAKFYLQCDVGDDYENCLSNDPDECPDDGAGVAGGKDTNCTDLCASDQYAVSFGGPPGFEPDGAVVEWPQPPVPTTCTSQSAGPSGAQIACCPCE